MGEVAYLYTKGAGYETSIPTLVGATTNWEACQYNNEDTSYVAIASPGGGTWVYTRDLYDLDTVSIDGDITGITVITYTKKDNYTNFKAAASIRTHSTVYDGALQFAVAGTYQMIAQLWAKNPFTDSVWTWSEINSLEAGVVLGGIGYSGYYRCTQVYVQINYDKTGTIYPENSLSRVGSIRHFYQPGTYRMEIQIGGLSTIPDYDSIDVAKAAVAEVTTQTEKEPTVTPPVVTPPVVVPPPKPTVTEVTAEVAAVIELAKREREWQATQKYIKSVSDKVTASQPGALSPAQQAAGVAALKEFAALTPEQQAARVQSTTQALGLKPAATRTPSIFTTALQTGQAVVRNLRTTISKLFGG